MKEIILGVSVVLIIILLAWLVGKIFSKPNQSEQKKLIKTSENGQKLLVTCPLCGSFLQKGQDLYSRVYRPMNVPHQLCTISGCPHCYPNPEPGLKRECPVCHKNVPTKDGHLVARLFNKSDGKKHVVVTGCTECVKHGSE